MRIARLKSSRSIRASIRRASARWGFRAAAGRAVREPEALPPDLEQVRRGLRRLHSVLSGLHYDAEATRAAHVAVKAFLRAAFKME
jgi:hypothetical protein